MVHSTYYVQCRCWAVYASSQKRPRPRPFSRCISIHNTVVHTYSVHSMHVLATGCLQADRDSRERKATSSSQKFNVRYPNPNSIAFRLVETGSPRRQECSWIMHHASTITVRESSSSCMEKGKNGLLPGPTAAASGEIKPANSTLYYVHTETYGTYIAASSSI